MVYIYVNIQYLQYIYIDTSGGLLFSWHLIIVLVQLGDSKLFHFIPCLSAHKQYKATHFEIDDDLHICLSIYNQQNSYIRFYIIFQLMENYNNNNIVLVLFLNS